MTETPIATGTDDSDRSEMPDTIVGGKRLVRVGRDRGLSLGERLAERLHKLTWRTPFHSMRLKGRYPLKLIAVPDEPLIGDVGRGRNLLEGKLCFRGEVRSIDSLDLGRPDWSVSFDRYFQSFMWLRDLSTVATRVQGAPIAELLMARWLQAHADRISGSAWTPENWGKRVLFWTTHAPLILSSDDLIYRSKVLNTLARGARHLERGADKTAAGHARIAAWCGVVASALLLPGGESRRVWGEAGLTRALASGVSDDGGLVSRSPVKLFDTVMLLTMLGASYAARRADQPASFGEVREKMVSALLSMTHGDGGLSSWQGGGALSQAEITSLIEASGVGTSVLRPSRDWGYQRLAAGSTVLIMDAAPPPIAQSVDCGCASTLAFELSDGANRLVVNCGGAAWGPASLAESLRTTAAHSTLIVGDSNSTAVHGDGTLGRGVNEVALSRFESDDTSRIDASHDGYVRRWGFVHRRELALSGDGRGLRGEDSLVPEGRRRRIEATPFTIRFHLGAGIRVSPTADGLAALLRMPGGVLWQFRCQGGALTVDDSLWIDPDGRPVATQQLVVSGSAQAGGATVEWVLKRAV